MAQVVYTGRALDDLERLFDSIAESDPYSATAAAAAIRTGVEALANHPLLGRRIEGEIRELVISYGKTGYVALYRVLPEQGLVRILAVRHQRELDYPA